MNIGIPQGSALGPLLFLFYINNLPNDSSKVTTISFADDPILSNFDYNCCNLSALANDELARMRNWMCASR